MAIAHLPAPTLHTGDRMTRDEFLRTWDALPSLKNAELIDGVVYVASPVSRSHWGLDKWANWLLTSYEFATPGCEAGNNGTWLMLESSPQPDAFLRIRPERGGQSSDTAKYPVGAPELIIEICVTRTEIDFGRKLVLYQRAGVREYVTIEELPTAQITWRVRKADGSYSIMPPGADGVFRSRVFPGLWMHADALRKGDGARLRAVLEAGIASAEHAEFAARLQA